MIYLVTGPPAAGKTTWVRERAQHGDITIDYDNLAASLTPTDSAGNWDQPAHVKTVTKAARQAAIDAALKLADKADVYVIHSMPAASTIARYRAAGAQIITIDPGKATVLARCKAERPWRIGQAARQWYADRAKPQVNGPPPSPASVAATRDW